jgi:hypothetical protein
MQTDMSTGSMGKCLSVKQFKKYHTYVLFDAEQLSYRHQSAALRLFEYS